MDVNHLSSKHKRAEHTYSQLLWLSRMQKMYGQAFFFFFCTTRGIKNSQLKNQF